MKKFLIFLFIFLILMLPAISFAANLIPCETVANPAHCTFDDIIKLVNNVIHFILFFLVIPICAIMFAYAGFLLVTAGGEAAGARTKAKSIFTNAAIGLIVAFAAWLIINLILTTLGYKGSWIGFK